MADLTAVALRDMARETMIRSGVHGFMRFAQQGEMLLVTDAVRRAQDGGEALKEALAAQGFVCGEQDGLLYIAPEDERIRVLVGDIPMPKVRWESDLHPVQALAARWVAQPPAPFTDAGRRLIVDTLRLTGQPGADVCSGIEVLRAHAAVMLRSGDRSGMHEAGKILTQWCLKEERT